MRGGNYESEGAGAGRGGSRQEHESRNSLKQMVALGENLEKKKDSRGQTSDETKNGEIIRSRRTHDRVGLESVKRGAEEDDRHAVEQQSRGTEAVEGVEDSVELR